MRRSEGTDVFDRYGNYALTVRSNAPIEKIRERLADAPEVNIGLSELADEVGTSPTALLRSFYQCSRLHTPYLPNSPANSPQQTALEEWSCHHRNSCCADLLIRAISPVRSKGGLA
jgi:hypothetical protein